MYARGNRVRSSQEEDCAYVQPVCMCVYVCMYVCMYVCVRMYVIAPVCVCVCVYEHGYIIQSTYLGALHSNRAREEHVDA
jgi:hypothetical protein